MQYLRYVCALRPRHDHVQRLVRTTGIALHRNGTLSRLGLRISPCAMRLTCVTEKTMIGSPRPTPCHGGSPRSTPDRGRNLNRRPCRRFFWPPTHTTDECMRIGVAPGVHYRSYCMFHMLRHCASSASALDGSPGTCRCPPNAGGDQTEKRQDTGQNGAFLRTGA